MSHDRGRYILHMEISRVIAARAKSICAVSVLRSAHHASTRSSILLFLVLLPIPFPFYGTERCSVQVLG
jgi:hypothetical protein